MCFGFSSSRALGFYRCLGGCTLAVVFLLGSIFPAAAEQAVRIASVAYPQGKGYVLNGISAIVEHDPVLQADLKKLGARLEWVPTPPQSVGATINEAFANHSVEFAHYGDLPSVILNAGGVETVVVVPGGSGMNVYVVVPVASSAKSIQDLKGKSIALHRGRPWEQVFARLLAENGLKLSDFRIKNLNPQAGAAALASGDVDAVVTLFDLFPLVDKGIGKVLWSSKTPGQNWKIRTELFGSREFIQRHPEITQAVANAQVRAAHWLSQPGNFETYLRLSARAGYPEAMVRAEYQNDSVPWKDAWNPKYDGVLAHYRRVVAYAKSSGLIRKEFDAAKLVETKFLKRALQDLDLQDYWRGETARVTTGKTGK
ncbi:MAG: ABC transporter substrate-binding protein [Zoogloeaceae bacterium]|jgi:sulfonate transport system substrate-binding protein|nr:ABC transporter substrate-binding protein [Zoogloeaceae bacterium]